MPPAHVPRVYDFPPPPPPLLEAEAAEQEEEESGSLPMSPPILLLPPDALHNVLGRLPLLQALACRSVCHLFRDAISSPSFLAALPPVRLLALRHPRAAASTPSLHAFDTALGRWLRLPLSFLPFPSSSPVTASPSLLYLWADTSAAPSAVGDPKNPKSLILCNPLARSYRLLPPLGSAWSRHGTVLAGPGGAALVLTELAALAYAPGADRWLKFSLNLPSKPRSPILMGGAVYTLCDVGTPWRSQWKLFSCGLHDLGGPRRWAPIERHEWGDVFDILKRPRLLPGAGGGRILMIGGLRSSFAIDAPCSTVLILRLDLATLEWDEAGRMPPEMYRCFGGVVPGPVAAAAAVAGGNNKVKVFGGDGRVWFSGKRVRGKLAMWEEEAIGKSRGGVWRWLDGLPGYNEGVYRGFVFDAGFTAMP
ncbi:SKP1-interacting partner 15-like [Phoenix dactylifera]|uniref:SKP1-interacting partner 15-like n=1 Tax=Phoenix dactylifera TaxID=42345 RepID=A0A8B9AMN7_PHODC|nr:SKP1-interacting partner 15-like [Phoenix dactylifera]